MLRVPFGDSGEKDVCAALGNGESTPNILPEQQHQPMRHQRHHRASSTTLFRQSGGGYAREHSTASKACGEHGAAQCWQIYALYV